MKIIWDSKKAAANPKNHDGVTFEDETIRIISAWKANEQQRRRYESQF